MRLYLKHLSYDVYVIVDMVVIIVPAQNAEPIEMLQKTHRPQDTV